MIKYKSVPLPELDGIKLSKLLEEYIEDPKKDDDGKNTRIK